jgi:hypothetical protein
MDSEDESFDDALSDFEEEDVLQELIQIRDFILQPPILVPLIIKSIIYLYFGPKGIQLSYLLQVTQYLLRTWF